MMHVSFCFVLLRMRIALLSAGLLFFTACNNSSAVGKKLKGCDSLVITFNAPGSDSIHNMISTTDTRAIQKLGRYLDGSPAENKECGFDGNILFFKAGKQVMPAVFQFRNDGCRFFTFDLDNTVMKNTMSNEAASFLESLSAGRNWY